MKPEFAQAASAVKASVALVGMDVDKDYNAPVRQQLNITGFPTIYYFV